MKSIGILGASGILGEALLRESFSHRSISIQLLQHQSSLSKFSGFCSIHQSLDTFFLKSDVLISLIPIWTFVDILNSTDIRKYGIQKLVAVSSTSALTKYNSDNLWEREYASRFLDSESALLEFCKNASINVSIVRPTMIWGSCRDLNVTFIQRFISRFGFCVLPSNGSGLRWPVHYLDLFAIIYNLLLDDSSGIFIVRGREELSYRNMVLRIFSWQGLNPLLIIMPSFLLGLCAFVARFITSKPYINASSFKRIDSTELLVKEAPSCLLSDGLFAPRDISDVVQPSSAAKFVNFILSKTFSRRSLP